MSKFLNTQELEAGLPVIKQSPNNLGVLEMIVRRPEVGEREEIQEGELDIESGLKGDNWLARGYKNNPDGSAHPDMQVNIMNARAIALIAVEKERWKLAGDQLFVDLDLSYDNLPPGTRLEIGNAELEVTAEPHLGCAKFIERFGKDAAIFVNSEAGKSVNMRGINAKVVKSGKILVGDKVIKS